MQTGKRIRELRLRRHMTQRQLAARAGMAQPTVSHLETGRNRKTAYLVQLAHALDVSAETLLGEHLAPLEVSDAWDALDERQREQFARDIRRTAEANLRLFRMLVRRPANSD